MIPALKSSSKFLLADSIYLFASSPPEELPGTLEEWNRFLSKQVNPSIHEEYHHMLRCFALQQVVNPILECLREGVSNAVDAQFNAKRENEPIYIELFGEH